MSDARGLLVALEGASGIGKSRLARELWERSPGSLLVEEAYRRLAPPPSLEVPTREELWRTERRLLAEEVRRGREARGARRVGRLVWADTGFLGPLTYSYGLARTDPSRNVVERIRRAVARSVRIRTLPVPDLTFYLDAPPSTVARRLAADRLRPPDRFAPRHAAVARVERGLWIGPLGSVLGDRFRRIDARDRPDRIVREILQVVRGLAPAARRHDSDPRELAGALLRAVPKAPARRSSSPPTRPSRSGRRRR